jgi:hypothetical protein
MVHSNIRHWTNPLTEKVKTPLTENIKVTVGFPEALIVLHQLHSQI